MKIRSLLLGSIAAAGLSTSAFAADPVQVLTTLNLCDALGLTGLTISSDNNCLQITGEVKYEFNWGDYKGSQLVAGTNTASGYDAFTIMDDDTYAIGDREFDWGSKVEAYLTFTGTADTDVGPAKAVIKLKYIDENQVRNEDNLGPNGIADATILRAAGPDGALGNADDIYVTAGPNGAFNTDPDDVAVIADDVQVFPVAPATTPIDDHAAGGDTTTGVIVDEGYVAIGGATVLSAGKKGSILQFADDAPFNWLGLFLSEKVDTGVKWRKDYLRTGGHVIQLVHDFGNGLSGGVGLEALNRTGFDAGTAVGVLAYKGDKVTAHIEAAAGGILDGTVETFGIHAGITGTFNILKVRAAVSGDSRTIGAVTTTYVNALASAEATFDMFKIAWSGEYSDLTSDNLNNADYGAGASVGVTVTDGITINLGGRWYHDGETNDDGGQAAAQVVAAVTETITVTGEVGVFLLQGPADDTDIYGKLGVKWSPGGGLTVEGIGEVHENGAYRATFKAGKVIN